MAKSDPDGKEEVGSPCGTGSSSQIIYAWARDAPKLELPENVGFKVGKDSPIKYIVLQVHYAHIDKFKGGQECWLNNFAFFFFWDLSYLYFWTKLFRNLKILVRFHFIYFYFFICIWVD